MEAATKLCSQKLRLTSSVLLVIVILIICHAQFSDDVRREPTVTIIHQTDPQGQNEVTEKSYSAQLEQLKDYELKRWALIKDFLDIFKSLSAPYLLSEGSLLQFHRDFSTGEADVDFTLESWWWMEGDNRDTLKTMLEDKKFTRNIVFGTFGEPGYEEAWGRDDIKVDLFSSIVANGTHTIAMWVGENKYFCDYPMEAAEEVMWWEGRRVRIPVPTEKAVEHMYSANWRHPFTSWRWELDPFLTGYCRY